MNDKTASTQTESTCQQEQEGCKAKETATNAPPASSTGSTGIYTSFVGDAQPKANSNS